MSTFHWPRLTYALLLSFSLSFAIFCAPRTHASALMTDQSDLWQDPAELGWGMQLVHQGQVIFATAFLYDVAGKPTWITAALTPTQKTPTQTEWKGDVVLPEGGPWFGAPKFDPTTVAAHKAGTMTWSIDSSNTNSGHLIYSVDGVTVTKSLVRTSLAPDDFRGKYAGMMSISNSCTGVQEVNVDIVVTQAGKGGTINMKRGTNNCGYGGTLIQDGQFGRIDGQFECGPVHDDGAFSFYEMQVTPIGFSARYWSYDTDTKCEASGYLGAARRR